MVWSIPNHLFCSNAEFKTLTLVKHITPLKTWETNYLHNGSSTTSIPAVKLNIILVYFYHKIFPIYFLSVILL